MVKWWARNLTALGKVVVVALVCASLAAAVIIAYSLMGFPHNP